jgi:hypothetical protein
MDGSSSNRHDNDEKQSIGSILEAIVILCNQPTEWKGLNFSDPAQLYHDMRSYAYIQHFLSSE